MGNSFAGNDYRTNLDGAGYSSLYEDSLHVTHVTMGANSGYCINGFCGRIWTRNSPGKEPVPIMEPARRSDLRLPSLSEIDVLWITAGLGCDGDTIAMTAATQPSIEDIILGGLPWIPKVNFYNPFLASENGDDFMKYFHVAAEEKSKREFFPIQPRVGLMSRMGRQVAETGWQRTETRQISRPNTVLSLSKYQQSCLWPTSTEVSAKRM